MEILRNLAVFGSKTAKFLVNVYGENISKIITSVPEETSYQKECKIRYIASLAFIGRGVSSSCS
jgi:hypothetical protein